MTNDTPTTESESTASHKRIPFGKRLKSAREAQNLERKDVAAHLHLNEKVIIMMENDRYPADLPVTFIRGYLRSYAKFLQIPDYETRQAIEPIQSKLTYSIPTVKTSEPLTSGNYFIQFFTYLISVTLIGLVGAWWYTHHTLPPLSLLTSSFSHALPSIQQTTFTESNLAEPNPPTMEAPSQPIDNTIHPPLRGPLVENKNHSYPTSNTTSANPIDNTTTTPPSSANIDSAALESAEKEPTEAKENKTTSNHKAASSGQIKEDDSQEDNSEDLEDG